MLKPGYYKGKISNYGIIKTKVGDPSPVIIFEIALDDQVHSVNWFGSFKDGMAREISLKALACCGFVQLNAFPRLALGVDSGLLDTDKLLDLTVEVKTDDEGKSFPQVRWINDSARRFRNSLGVEEAAALMATMGLESDFAMIAKQNGYQVTTERSFDNLKKERVSSPFNEVDDIKIPF